MITRRIENEPNISKQMEDFVAFRAQIDFLIPTAAITVQETQIKMHYAATPRRNILPSSPTERRSGQVDEDAVALPSSLLKEAYPYEP